MLDHKYYRKRVKQTLDFIIPKNKNGSATKKVLYIDALGKMKKTKREIKYDLIFVNGTLGKSKDIVGFVTSLQKYSRPSTRILIYQHNHLWQWILGFSEKLKLKHQEGIQNWLSIADTSVYLSGCGFEVTRVFKRTLCPVFAFGLGSLINWAGVLLPFFDFFKLDQFILARPLPDLFQNYSIESLTVCITVRNERDNIEKIVKTLPIVCKNQEILFVEGHSSDGTRDEIERVIKKYPGKNVRVIGQPGKGQGDAIKVGFKDAKGDVVILYEGDGTSDPGDLKYFYDAMRAGRFEFIEGSRFVYPLVSAAMPLPNKLGNIFFAKWFSFFLGQRTTDVLSGIKAILKRDYDLLFERWGFLGLHDPFGDFELLYGAARMGLRFGELPMRYYPRVYGTSKSNVLKHGLYLIRMALKGYLIFRSH